MYCCPECFNDEHLQAIIKNVQTKQGICDYCNTDSKYLANVSELRDTFEPILSLYQQEKIEFKQEQTLGQWLKTDWDSFSEKVSSASLNLLISDIFENPSYIQGMFVPVFESVTDNVEKWVMFREEIKYSNRFFPEMKVDLEDLKTVIVNLVSEIGGSIVHRARIKNTEKSFQAEDLLMPPNEKASNGRANPNGIPYFYAASDFHTAITEVRPSPADIVYTASFEIQRKCHVIDLRHPRKTISPFYAAKNEQNLIRIRKNIGLLTEFAKDLSRAIIPRKADLDYLPTQYISEFIKHCGFDGILFGSSLNRNGYNLALFSDYQAKPNKLREFKIISVSIDHIEISAQDES